MTLNDEIYLSTVLRMATLGEPRPSQKTLLGMWIKKRVANNPFIKVELEKRCPTWVRPDAELMDFLEACNFVRKLNLLTHRGWLGYCKSGKKPANIPSTPDIMYRNKGWKSWPHWLVSDEAGATIDRDRAGKFARMEKTRKKIRELGLKSKEEWLVYRSEHHVSGIPLHPEHFYPNFSWSEFLGLQK